MMVEERVVERYEKNGFVLGLDSAQRCFSHPPDAFSLDFDSVYPTPYFISAFTRRSFSV